MTLKSRFVVLVAAAGLTSGLLAAAQAPTPMSDETYVKTMKQVGPTFQSLQKANASMQHVQGVKDAQVLSDLFKQVQAYWEAKKAEDAVGFAKSAVAAADQTVTASQKMDMASLAESQKSLAAACQGCHMAHRERLPDGTFRIK
jgi:hypothetical protein